MSFGASGAASRSGLPFACDAAVASIGKPRTLDDGTIRYDARIRVPGGELKKSFRKKGDANRWLAQIGTDMARDEYVDQRRSRKPVEHWAALWLESKRGNKPSSIARNRSTYQKQILPYFKGKPVGDLRHDDIVTWVAELDAAGLKNSSIKKARAAMAGAMRIAVRSGAIRANPVDDIAIPSDEPKEAVFLDADQVARLIEELEAGHTPAYGLWCRLVVNTGIRLGESLALTTEDIRFTADTAEISVSKSVSEVGGVITIQTPKTSRSVRRIIVTGVLVADLAVHVAGLESGAYLWSNGRGGPVSNANLRTRHFKPAAERAGLPAGATPHCLRHTMASLLIAAGARPDEIKNRMGHSKITTTFDQYGHLFPAQGEETAGLITEALENI